MKAICVYFAKPAGPETGMYLSTLRTANMTLYLAQTAQELSDLATEHKADFVMFGDSRFPRRPTPIEFARPMFEKYVRLNNDHH